MKIKIFFLVVFCLTSLTDIFAQNLQTERIREISNDKKAIFLRGGIFHGGKMENRSTLQSMRQSYTANNGQERLVFDLTGEGLPKIYGHLNEGENKLYLDLFNVDLPNGFSPLGTGKFIKGIDFFKITQESLSLEISFDRGVGIDVFYLAAPLRLVIDIKG